MSHQDGHCATPGETIYVKHDTSACVTIFPAGDPGSGTVMKPLCSMEPVPMLLSSTRSLVVVRGTVQGGTWTFSGQGGAALSIVGQNTGLIAGGASPGFSMQSGSVYVRDLEVSLSASTAIEVGGGTLVLQGVTVATNTGTGISVAGGSLTTNKVTVDSCSGGGILLDGAAFDVENTTVSNCGPAQDPATSVAWGGIYVKSLPVTGSKALSLVTIENNKNTGIACVASANLSATGVFAMGNTGIDIGSSCGVTKCPSPGPTCGAQ
jgi:hypothetical protein